MPSQADWRIISPLQPRQGRFTRNRIGRREGVWVVGVCGTSLPQIDETRCLACRTSNCRMLGIMPNVQIFRSAQKGRTLTSGE
ncbi:uncharacterized protein BDW43DRAFT_65261 [Aspergillus alliaceus]|uniref:uncharacterized protein n=1 Tax=Petromyces alliaceus TaxID=209559 RepID=UPI0012A4B348|nr:uncharacterized protein BDW43DRAFT_65261 [Aspergillus alliaceus]KAB8234211.1 hypothetical protein BDW43DRAFT_65261 [Aspergillus alliaceus]